MLLISNGRITMRVTSGAYTSIYKHKGYFIVGTKRRQMPINKVESAPVSEPVKVAKKAEPVEASVEETNEKDWIAELMEKPISQWSKDETVEFAKANDIDTSSARKLGEAKDIIKSWMEEKNR